MNNACISIISPKISSRNFLSEDQAIAIYEIKLSNDVRPFKTRTRAAEVSRLFGVSTKAVRDIWSRRTWSKETFHMLPNRPLSCSFFEFNNLALSSTTVQSYKCDPTKSYQDSTLQSQVLETPDRRKLLTTEGYALSEVLDRDSNMGMVRILHSEQDDPFHDDWPFWNNK